MKPIEEMGIGTRQWSVDKYGDVRTEDGILVMNGNFTSSQARLIAEAPRMYEALRRLIIEIDKVLDHTAEGMAVIDCECSGIELAADEAREVMADAGGEG